jgi:chloride channel 7
MIALLATIIRWPLSCLTNRMKRLKRKNLCLTFRMLNLEVQYEFMVMFYYFLLWFFFTMITSGTAVPCGIFLPCIIIGCALGQMYSIIAFQISPGSIYLHPQSYSVIGAAAMLSGSTRMTYSLAVIMLETTSNVDLFLPMIFALFTSYGVGSLFTRSLYLGTLRTKNIPVLDKGIPKCNRKFTADLLMT